MVLARAGAEKTFPIRYLFGKVCCLRASHRTTRGPAARPTPNIIFGKVGTMNPPPKRPNAERRSREHLTPAEIDRLIAAARQLGRHGHRDATMILLAYRHGLRVSELVSLRREQLDLRQGLLHVRRRKNGLPSTHPLHGPELRALRQVLHAYPETAYVFVSERGAPMIAATFRKLVARAGEAAKLGMPIHPHMLRHSTGYKLANDGQDTRAIQHYLGHRNIQHTVAYTRLDASRFNDFWPD
jgi:type 1 fimbriae regulatory protein FimB